MRNRDQNKAYENKRWHKAMKRAAKRRHNWRMEVQRRAHLFRWNKGAGETAYRPQSERKKAGTLGGFLRKIFSRRSA